jgi:hypothetical protein
VGPHGAVKVSTVTNGSDDELDGFIREQQKDLSVRKSIKVKLPIRQHIKLHALKLVTEDNISETVETALDEFLERKEGSDAEAQAASQMADEVTGDAETG